MMDDLERLIAIEEIRVLKARYFRAMDMKDGDLLQGLFAEDAVLDFRGAATDGKTGVNLLSGIDEPLRGRALITRTILSSGRELNTIHHGMMPEIEITSDSTATGIWAMQDLSHMPKGSGYREYRGWGHYHETYERSAGKWRIKTLRLTRIRFDAIPE